MHIFTKISFKIDQNEQFDNVERPVFILIFAMCSYWALPRQWSLQSAWHLPFQFVLGFLRAKRLFWFSFHAPNHPHAEPTLWSYVHQCCLYCHRQHTWLPFDLYPMISLRLLADRLHRRHRALDAINNLLKRTEWDTNTINRNASDMVYFLFFSSSSSF